MVWSWTENYLVVSYTLKMLKNKNKKLSPDGCGKCMPVTPAPWKAEAKPEQFSRTLSQN